MKAADKGVITGNLTSDLILVRYLICDLSEKMFKERWTLVARVLRVKQVA